MQILATATGAEAVVDVPVIISDKLQQSFVESVEVPQTQFIDSMVGFPVASQRQGSQCKLCRRRRFARCSSWIGTRPSLCNDRPDGPDSSVWRCTRCSSCQVVDVPAVSQVVPEFPAKPGGASDQLIDEVR